MCEEEKLILAPWLDNPADDVRRLVYADWLEDRGHVERAAAVRKFAGKKMPLIVAVDFLPLIRDVAATRIGKKRADRADIARILYEHGVRSTEGHLRFVRRFIDPRDLSNSTQSHEAAVRQYAAWLRSNRVKLQAQCLAVADEILTART